MDTEIFLVPMKWHGDINDTESWFLYGFDQLQEMKGIAVDKLFPKMVKQLFFTDRDEWIVPGLLDAEAHSVTHILAYNESFTPKYALYRVDRVEAVSLTARSHRFVCSLDALGTATLMGPLSISGMWDLYPEGLGERCVPYDSPMVIAPAYSVKLPVMSYVNDYYAVNKNFVCVTVAGVDEDGGFALYGAVCRLDETRRITAYAYDSAGTYAYKDMPMLDEIVNDPEDFTPFDTATRITGMFISRRWAFRGGLADHTDGSTHYDPLFTNTGQYVSTASGCVMIKLPYAGQNVMTRTQTVTGTLPMSRALWGLATAEIRDTMGRVVGTIDTKLAQGSTDEATLSGLTLETVASITGIQSRLVLPDGSMICWSEGTLPYNSSAYKEYLAYTAEYDRQMLSIANQRALTDLAVGSMESIVNGTLAGGLAGGGTKGKTGSAGAIVGGITTLVGVGANVLRYQSETELRQQELDAKIGMIKSTPDTAYLSSSDTMLAWIRSLGLETYVDPPTFGVDSIAVRLPKDSFTSVWQSDESAQPQWTAVHTWNPDYIKLLTYNGVYGGGRYADLDDTIFSKILEETEEEVQHTFIKAKDITSITSARETGEYTPTWLQRIVAQRIRQGVRVRFIQYVT